jgi:hypothetical protein
VTRRRSDQAAKRHDGLTAGLEDDPASIEIRPEPAPEEQEAILAALIQLLEGKSAETPPAISRWTAAGRREAMRSRGDDRDSGWTGRRTTTW